MPQVDQLLFARYQDHMRIITASVGRSLVQGRQTVLVSATLSPKVLQRASQWVQGAQQHSSSGSSSSITDARHTRQQLKQSSR